MFCIKCGKPVADGAVFCAYCGAKVVIPGQAAPGAAGSAPGSAGAAPSTGPSVSSDTYRAAAGAFRQYTESSHANQNPGTPARFDIAEFWKTHCAPILATHNESTFMQPEKWHAGSSAGIPRDTLAKACKFVCGNSVVPEEIIALIIVSPFAVPTASGRTGFVFCRDRFCFKAMPNPRDGYKGMLIGGPLYSMAKSAGRTSAAIRYVDIASLSAHGEYLDIFLKQGGKQTLYLGAHFSPIRTKAVFDELILSLRG